MYDLICIGDITVDLYFKTESLKVEDNRLSLAMGGKYPSNLFYQGLGGNAANVAIDASSFELDTAICGLIGENAFKQIIIQHLVKKNVSTELLMFLGDYISISSILLLENGERTIFHYTTPTAPFNIASHMMTQLSEAKAYFIAHIPPPTLGEKIDLVNHISKFDKPIFMNLSTNDLKFRLSELKPILDHCDCLFLNCNEFANLVGEDYEKIDFKKNISGKLGFNKKLLVLTDGQNGSYAYNSGEVLYQKANPVENIIDTTGAGDAYTAGFIASFMKEPDIQKAIGTASEFAAKKLTRLGAN